MLSDPQKRQIYDQYGEEGLKDGFFPGGGGGGGGGGTAGFHPRAAEDIFAELFGRGGFGGFPGGGGGSFHASGMEDIFGGGGGFGGHRMNGGGPRRPKKDATHEMKLPCTLEELYTGSCRKMKISRRRIDPSTKVARQESEILSVDVRPGWKKGTKITFQEKGDEHPGRIPADIAFVVDEKRHPTFTRDGNDLVHVHRVPLREALTGTVVELQTLDNRMLRIPVNEIVKPSMQKVVAGEGMPISKSGGKGNLRIKFEVLFPSQLSTDQKEALKAALPAH